ncbi:extracellular solute-binding protein [Halalkalibacter urbisdiaboli]|uniref:extracellular solute-binding protein n=1 Tax=Halalkalibacter urbisdiaboli TaxID=1960589 RepID=UPI000B448F7E|nr:extracellular solute-binding protein [Halalkalibacter urbisdiaboli]
MKKYIAVFLVFCLLSIALIGCSKDTSKEQTEDGKVILTGLILKHPLTKNIAEMEWLQEAEERAGVSIKWEEVSADWDQKKGAMLAGGDIPDLIVGPNAITDADFAKFPGLFQDLTELIAEHGPNVQTMFHEKPETEIIATQLDGEILGLPKYQRFWPETATRQFINKQWLDNLGLDMPTNWDELYQVLKAFKEQDANGNGDPNDEIPMDFAPTGTTGFGFFQPTVLLGSTGMTISGGGGQGYFVEDGQVKNFLIDERYKELVQFLNKLWADDLINSEVFTQDYSSFQSISRGEGSNAKIGYTYGWELTDRFGNELSTQYEPMPQIKVSASSADEVSWSYDYNQLNYGINMVQMSSATKNKEAAMKFINELYDPKVSMQVLFGSIGPNISDNGDGSYSVLPPQDESMDPGTWKWTSTWADNGPMYISDSLELELGTDMQSVDSQTEPLMSAFESIDTVKDVYPGMFVKYTDEDNNKMSLTNTELMNLAMAKYSQWITEGGIETEWDSYVEQLKNIGIEQNIEIMQSYYDDYVSAIQ